MLLSIGLAAAVYHPHCLALRTGNLAFRLDRNFASYADQRLYVVSDFLGLAETISGKSRRKLDLHGHLIEGALTRQNDLVMGGKSRKAH